MILHFIQRIMWKIFATFLLSFHAQNTPLSGRACTHTRWFETLKKLFRDRKVTAVASFSFWINSGNSAATEETETESEHQQKWQKHNIELVFLPLLLVLFMRKERKRRVEKKNCLLYSFPYTHSTHILLSITRALSSVAAQRHRVREERRAKA